MQENSTQGMSELSSTEAVHYDRQLRVWGVAAQQRLSRACLLFLSVDGIQVELLKNLVLSGVGKILLVDFIEDESPGNCISTGTRDGAIMDTHTTYINGNNGARASTRTTRRSRSRSRNRVVSSSRSPRASSPKKNNGTSTTLTSTTNTAPGTTSNTSPASGAGAVLVTELDVESNFFLEPKDICKPKISCIAAAVGELNPLVKVEVVRLNSGTLESSVSFQAADVVFGTIGGRGLHSTSDGEDRTKTTGVSFCESLSELCAKHDTSLFLLAHSGVYGFCFSRLADGCCGGHPATQLASPGPTFAELLAQGQQQVNVKNTNTKLPAHPETRIKNDHIRRFFEEFFREKERKGADEDDHFSRCFRLPAPLVTVSATLGGVISQEVIKVLTGKDKPLRNCVLGDLTEMLVIVEDIVGAGQSCDRPGVNLNATKSKGQGSVSLTSGNLSSGAGVGIMGERPTTTANTAAGAAQDADEIVISDSENEDKEPGVTTEEAIKGGPVENRGVNGATSPAVKKEDVVDVISLSDSD
ncbi:unnamed protein product [Amoebophrya sp. A25]|nr:unnamed protein product [Amoebophrya sp. A25]|eukprot:GSA25T00012116001.1